MDDLNSVPETVAADSASNFPTNAREYQNNGVSYCIYAGHTANIEIKTTEAIEKSQIIRM